MLLSGRTTMRTSHLGTLLNGSKKAAVLNVEYVVRVA